MRSARGGFKAASTRVKKMGTRVSREGKRGRERQEKKRVTSIKNKRKRISLKERQKINKYWKKSYENMKDKILMKKEHNKHH